MLECNNNTRTSIVTINVKDDDCILLDDDKKNPFTHTHTHTHTCSNAENASKENDRLSSRQKTICPRKKGTARANTDRAARRTICLTVYLNLFYS